VVSLRKNDPVNERKILNKYRGMVFRDPSDGEIYMIDSDDLVLEAGRCGGWAIKAFAADSEGDDDFEVFKILEKKLIWYIASTEQPEESNVQINTVHPANDSSSDEESN